MCISDKHYHKELQPLPNMNAWKFQMYFFDNLTETFGSIRTLIIPPEAAIDAYIYDILFLRCLQKTGNLGSGQI